MRAVAFALQVTHISQRRLQFRPYPPIIYVYDDLFTFLKLIADKYNEISMKIRKRKNMHDLKKYRGNAIQINDMLTKTTAWTGLIN